MKRRTFEWLDWSKQFPNTAYNRDGATYWTASGHSASIEGPSAADSAGWRVGNGLKRYPLRADAEKAALDRLYSDLRKQSALVQDDIKRMKALRPAR